MELLAAIRAGSLEEVQRLLREGADLNEGGVEGVTPLISAAVAGQANITSALLDAGADIDKADDNFQTALLHAICQRNDEVTDLLLERGADPAVDDWLAFSFAVRFGRIPLVQHLLSIGADPNAQDEDDPSPLMDAVARGNLDLIRVLLEAGADPQMTAEDDMTAFDLAVQNRQKEIVELLEGHVEPTTRTLLAAINAPDAKMVEKLIAQGVSVNFSDADDYTPLSWAAENGSTRIARLLIEAGADLETRDWKEQTPLWTAVMADHARVTRLLLEAGAKTDIVDESGETLLQTAVAYESFRCVEPLLKAGADPNVVEEESPAALHWAAVKGSQKLTDPLLDAGADPNIALLGECEYSEFEGLAPGTTPLMIAARKRNLELVNRLLDAGADWQLKDSHGRTAVDLATQAGATEILKRLEVVGAGVDYGSKQLHRAGLLEAVKQQDVAGVRTALQSGAPTDLQEKRTERTPLMLGCLHGNPEIVKLLLDAGADPDGHTRWGEYALTNAVVRGHAEVARLLLDAGAQVDIQYEPRSVPAEDSKYVIASRFCPLADAVAGGHEDIAELLLEAGAEVNAVSSDGDSPLLAAVTDRHFALAHRLLEAGAQPRPEDDDYLDLLQWDERAASVTYQQSLDEVSDVAGVEPQEVEFLPGAFSFRFTIPDQNDPGDKHADRTEAILKWSKKFHQDYQSLADRVNAVIDQLRERIAVRGYHLLDAGMPHGCGPMTRFLVLVPTADHFAVMAAFGTYGNDDELCNRDLIAWFRAFEKEHPFTLRGCENDTIVIELDRPLDNGKEWARKLLEFNSDIWPHDDLAPFQRQLETSTRIHFWWD